MVGRKTKLFKKQMVVWMDRKKYINRYQNGRLDGWMDKIDDKNRMDGWMDRKKIDGWLNGWIYIFFLKRQIVRLDGHGKPQKDGWMDIKNRCTVGWT